MGTESIRLLQLTLKKTTTTKKKIKNVFLRINANFFFLLNANLLFFYIIRLKIIDLTCNYVRIIKLCFFLFRFYINNGELTLTLRLSLSLSCIRFLLSSLKSIFTDMRFKIILFFFYYYYCSRFGSFNEPVYACKSLKKKGSLTHPLLYQLFFFL